MDGKLRLWIKLRVKERFTPSICVIRMIDRTVLENSVSFFKELQLLP